MIPQSFYSSSTVFPVSYIKRVMKQRVNDIYEQEWVSEVNTNNQCLNYRIFKKKLELEKYLKILDMRARINLCKLRCANIKIPTVMGRFENIAVHERICTLCTRECIGDEFHYLFECNAFTNVRKLYIKPYFRKNPSTLKMEQLFQTRSEDKLMKLSLFCDKLRVAFKS